MRGVVNACPPVRAARGSGGETGAPGAGIILEVKKGLAAGGAAAAAVLTPSEDYSVSDLNSTSVGAKITLEEALVEGESLWCSYKYWHADKPLEWIVAQICALCGVTSTEIQPAVFANDIKAVFSQSTAADWALGAASDTEYDTGNIYLENPFPRHITASWTPVETPAGGTWAAGADYAGIESGGAGWASIKTAQPLAYGTFQATFPASSSGYDKYWHFISDNGNRAASSGYALKISGAAPQISLCRADAGTLTALWSAAGVNPHTLRVSRDSSGRFRLWNIPAGGAPADFGVVAQDNAYSASNYLVAAFNSAGYNQKIQAIAADAQESSGPCDYYPSGCYISPEIDGTASLKCWGGITSSGIAPAGTSAAVEYRSKAGSGDAWGAWTAPGAGGTVPATDRYLQLRWYGYSSADQYYSPNLAEWRIEYYTSRTAIPLVNMTGLTCMGALESLAAMCCYEIGFDGEDKFVFRPRYSTMAPLGTLGESEIEKILELTDGAERVYTRVKVDFGGYSKTVDPVTQGDAAPHAISKYGVKELAVSSGNFLPAGNVDLAYAIAPTVYGYVSVPRKRASIACRFFSQYELGDVVRVNFKEADVLRYWLWGDTNVYWGQPDLAWHSPAAISVDPMLYGIDMRVEGVEFDLANWRANFDLVEA